MENQSDIYTNDGTVDIHKNRANKKKTGNWKACGFILGNQCLERLAYYGMSTNLINYVQKYLGQENATAANNVTNWSGTCYITPLVGAFLADAFLGRYWTIATFSMVYVSGMILLTLSASLNTSLKSPLCYVALYMAALGSGAIKPCVTSFGANQFDETDQVEKKNKSRFFNWVYFSMNIGMLIGTSVLVWMQMKLGWGWGFGVSAFAMATAVGLFFSGTIFYRLEEAKGSPFTRTFQVLVASCRKFNVQVPSDNSLLYETTDDLEGANLIIRCKLQHTDRLRFFDKAAVETNSTADRTPDGLANGWRLCTVTQVEEFKSIIQLVPIWASGIVFACVFSQISSTFIIQGNKMDPHVGPSLKIPSACLALFNAVGVIMGIPFYDWLIVPHAKRFTGYAQGFTQLQRIGIGLAISILTMLMAGALEFFRLNAVRNGSYYDRDYVPISIFWQVPQYLLIGLAEVFTMVGQTEFFYDEAPDAMRSSCSALSLTTLALGNYLSSLLVTIVTQVTTANGNIGWIPNNINRGRLDCFFALLALLCILNFFVFLWIAKGYTYKNVTIPNG